MLKTPGLVLAATSVLALGLVGANQLMRQPAESPQRVGRVPKRTDAFRVAVQPDLFVATDFVWVQNNCSRKALGVVNDHGSWYQLRPCSLPARGVRPLLPIDAALFSSQGMVIGFKRMIVNEARLESFKALYATSLRQDTSACSKFGQGSYPLLVVVAKQLCEPLSYDQI